VGISKGGRITRGEKLCYSERLKSIYDKQNLNPKEAGMEAVSGAAVFF